jgi:hypothetical protein
MHKVQLQFDGFPERVSIVAGFTESDGVAGLLGQTGFLDNYRVTFELYKWQFEIANKPEDAD